jgi:methyltransferase of FxLD system
MARTASERLRRSLTADLRRQGWLRSPAVEDAFREVARERFVPEALVDRGLEAIYRDESIVTKRTAEGMAISSSSQPAIMAKMLDLLDVQPGDRVLEIGAGTGYNAALLAHLTTRTGRVTSVDIDAEIVRRARRALRETQTRVKVIVGDGRAGHSACAPFDRIIVTASAPEIPAAWFDQLADGGRLVVPMNLRPAGGGIQAIPALQRQGQILTSIETTWGWFMSLHAGDGGPPVREPILNANHSHDSLNSSLAAMTGPGVGPLSASAAHRLLCALLSPPHKPVRRGVTSFVDGAPASLLIYLMLAIAPRRLISQHDKQRWGIGLVDGRTHSAAIVSLRNPWSRIEPSHPVRQARWRLDAYGGDAAAQQLDQLIQEWRPIERAGRTKLKIVARRSENVMTPRFDWVRA